MTIKDHLAETLLKINHVVVGFYSLILKSDTENLRVSFIQCTMNRWSERG